MTQEIYSGSQTAAADHILFLKKHLALRNNGVFAQRKLIYEKKKNQSKA